VFLSRGKRLQPLGFASYQPILVEVFKPIRGHSFIQQQSREQRTVVVKLKLPDPPLLQTTATPTQDTRGHLRLDTLEFGSHGYRHRCVQTHTHL